MLKIALIVIAVVVVLFVVVVASQPSRFRVERSIVVDASPAAVAAQVRDFRRWPAWSPFERLDPNLQRRYEGPDAGEGSVYDWVGNKDAGEGRATVVADDPQRIAIQLDFRKPFKATNLAEFGLQPLDGGKTRVTWAMSGTRNFMFKAMGLFMSMDKRVGGMFEQGLKDLKRVAEQAPA